MTEKSEIIEKLYGLCKQAENRPHTESYELTQNEDGTFNLTSYFAGPLEGDRSSCVGLSHGEGGVEGIDFIINPTDGKKKVNTDINGTRFANITMRFPNYNSAWATLHKDGKINVDSERLGPFTDDHPMYGEFTRLSPEESYRPAGNDSENFGLLTEEMKYQFVNLTDRLISKAEGLI